MVSPFIMILVALLLAFAISEILKRILGIPRVVGQVGAGLILGITFFKPYLFDQENIDVLSFLANFGIILLFYYVGLETNLSMFRKNLKESASISLINTIFPLALGFVTMKYLFGLSSQVSIIISIALSVSAQSITLDLLDELKLVRSRLGSMIIDAGAVDDIIESVLVIVILSFFQFTVTEISRTRLMIGLLFFVALVCASRIWIIPYTLRFFDQEKSSTARFTAALLIVLLIASLTELSGLNILIGAMIAGMLVRQTILRDNRIANWEEHDIARSIHIISFGFLIPLFFVWVGLNTNLSSIEGNGLFLIVLIAIALLGTIGGTTIAVMLNKGSFREGITIGWGLTPKGDVDLAIATLALKEGIFTPGIFASFVLMALTTTVISPLVFKYLIISSKKKTSR